MIGMCFLLLLLLLLQLGGGGAKLVSPAGAAGPVVCCCSAAAPLPCTRVRLIPQICYTVGFWRAQRRKRVSVQTHCG